MRGRQEGGRQEGSQDGQASRQREGKWTMSSTRGSGDGLHSSEKGSRATQITCAEMHMTLPQTLENKRQRHDGLGNSKTGKHGTISSVSNAEWRRIQFRYFFHADLNSAGPKALWSLCHHFLSQFGLVGEIIHSAETK